MKKGLICHVSCAVILFAVLLFIYQGPVFAGVTGKIAGTVRDAATGDPLPGVNIILTGTSMGAATDVKGNYFIVNVPPGVYDVEASMIGYGAMRKTGVRVSTDHTTPVDFELKETTIAGAEVTVVAEREVVQMDMSASQISSNVEEIRAVPLVSDVREYINLQAGIENNFIRGGGLDETQFMVDGLTVVDNRTNQPVQMVNLSAIKEISIIKGGFNAEYGNVRSGLINIVTKEPGQNYTASVDFRITKPARKHGGPSIFDHKNYWLRPYLDKAVAFEGTNSGAWDEYTQQQYKSFSGWNEVAKNHKLNNDDDPTNDVTPQDLYNVFIWQHRAEGSKELGHPYPGSYGDKPDWLADVSFGGPVPVIGKYLGNLTFFASYYNKWEMFGLPTSRDYFKENNSMVKFLSRLSPSMKLGVDLLYGETHSVARSLNGSNPGYLVNGYDIFYREGRIYGGAATYYPGALNPFKVYRNVLGLSFDHIISPSTFYNVRMSHLYVRNVCGVELEERDPTIIKYFGGIGVTEEPMGVKTSGGPLLMQDGMYYGAHSAGARDHSKSRAFNFKFDLTSQINQYHQIKAGFTYNYDDLYTYYEKNRWESTWENWYVDWRRFPYRMGAYIQDKLEFEGMIANVGVRMDYNEPNTDWVDLQSEPYSKWYKAKYKKAIFQNAPKVRAKGHLKISPRLGISHPISANAKLYFNYGHFYSMPPSSDMYQIHWGKASRSIYILGNPSADLPKTVAYELGWEYNLGDMFLFHVSGYYKDVTDQTGQVRYTSFDGQVDYRTFENNFYEDIRGFELRIDKRWGKWITGWLNYNYIVNTSGYVGREHYFEDQREQRIYGLQNPYQEVPVARPYARASIMVTSPHDFGPSVGNFKPLANFRWNTLFHYKSGRYETWDPLDTRELRNNIHWKSSYIFDMRFTKSITVGKFTSELFCEIQNIFNDKNVWSSKAFASSDDHRRYMESLHLPMYKGAEYKAEGYVGGDDKPGDLRSDDKPYINDPNRTYLMYLNPRVIWFGVRMDF